MTTITTSTAVLTAPERRPWQEIRLLGVSLPVIALGLIVLLTAALRFINIQAIGDGNLYYTAAIESMLQSPSNFFFVAAEPGGSVSIDKPPVGLWLQAISAMFLGVNGFAVVLPQILAGIISVPILYHLVKRYAGTVAGLIAALVLAITPVAIATDRNNTMDSTLILTLLLAAWAFIKATESGRLRWLLIGAALIGIGFNIKMLQAFLPVPAFYALYFFGAKLGWRRKIGYLTLTTILLLAVSLSWAIIVDLTPADQRPYVGSSETNSVLELMIGYNGLQRLLGGAGPGNASGGSFTPPQGSPPPMMAGGPPGAGSIGTGEIGQAGVFRLFTTPLANEISWLLPFGLIAVGLLVFSGRIRFPLSREHQAAVLFGGWLLIEVVFFSAASFFHAYYLAMLAPPLAALVGIGAVRLWQLIQAKSIRWRVVFIALGAGTLLFQAWTASQYLTLGWWIIPVAGLLLVGAVLLIQRLRPARGWMLAGFTCVIAAMLIIPAGWAALTTLDPSPSSVLPHAYAGDLGLEGNRPAGFASGPGGFGVGSVDADLLAYLQANTQGMTYLMAVPSSMQGAAYVLETGRGVLYLGGFNGSDQVIDSAGLSELVAAGELRYILWSAGPMMLMGAGGSSDLSAWLQSDCAVVSGFASTITLYDCAPSPSGA
ncbi:MAG: glycosyltransferase family 39 protein [Anaerolineae bacterium]|nr:glycosyltransferase family 39 protein [Anaerolineae bacterium]